MTNGEKIEKIIKETMEFYNLMLKSGKTKQDAKDYVLTDLLVEKWIIESVIEEVKNKLNLS